MELRPGLPFSDLEWGAVVTAGEGGGGEEGARTSGPCSLGRTQQQKDGLRAGEGPTLNPGEPEGRYLVRMEATVWDTRIRRCPVIQGPREPWGLEGRSVKGSVRRGWGSFIPGTDPTQILGDGVWLRASASCSLPQHP